MKYTLKDYQDEAVRDVLTSLRKARKRWREEGDRHSFSLSAITGAGKTVMAAAVFEALFHGNDDYDIDADPNAVVIWFSDDPSLNEQTRFRILEAADRIDFSKLVVVQNTFNQEKLAPGNIYFLNTHKLGKNSLLTRGHDQYDEDDNKGQITLPEMRPDGRSYTIWDTIQNTIGDPNLTLYLVLDEAHRGMRSSSRNLQDEDKSTIVKRLINGSGVMPAIPVVWGISATVQRFNEAMAGTQGRGTLPNVEVDPIKVQESGLLKDTVLLDIPVEVGQFDTVLVRRATDKIKGSTDAWVEYTKQQGIETVHPLMVLQVPNTPDPKEIGKALAVIFDRWPELPHEAVAHVLGDHTAQQFGPVEVPYISPEKVQDSMWVRILIAKDAISTGWDCPRAEVLVSFRPAKDKTHITQLLGRMIRTPLARRIPGNDRLNSVDCLLPFFDKKTVKSVADLLMTGTDENTPAIRRVLVNPKEMIPNPEVPEAVWEKLLSLPSQSLPQRAAKPVKRLTALAHELAADGILAAAGKKAHAEMHKVLDGARARYATQIDEARRSVLMMEGETLIADLQHETKTFEDFVAKADYAVIDDAYRRACRILSADVARTYSEYLADKNSGVDSDEALMDAHTDIAALGFVADVKDLVDTEAEKLANAWFARYRVEFRNLSDERQDTYRQIKEMSTAPQVIDLARPRSWMEATAALEADGSETILPLYKDHLLCGEDGRFPSELNGWEYDVLMAEMTRQNFLAWYRNPSRSSQDSLAIAYEEAGRYRTVRPDFLFFGKTLGKDVTATIVDPHGSHLSDALPKLRGLADYADQHGLHYQRIESVAKIGDKLRLLDLMSPSVREAIVEAEDAKSLYQGSHALDY